MRQIVVEAETPDDSRTMFRLRVDEALVADGLTAVQAHAVKRFRIRLKVPK
jgi:hypothetical protein